MPTFGAVKAEIALVVENGVSATDPRVLIRTNEAMRALSIDVPRGIFVGSVIQATVLLGPGGLLTLPATMDNVIALEGLTVATPAFDGWYNIVSESTFVDPDDIMDTPLIDQGVVAGARTYLAPELTAGMVVSVWGLKKFVSAAVDADELFVSSVRAIKRMILSIQNSERYDKVQEAAAQAQEAVEILVKELRRNLSDPQRYASRLSQWRIEESTYAPGTLGNTRARIALDINGGQKLGRTKVNRLVRRALEWINQRVYEYELIERNRIKDSVPVLVAVPTDPAAVLPPMQFEIVRQVFQALLAEDNQGLDEDRGTGKLTPGAELAVAQNLWKEAGNLLMRVLDAQLEALRRTTYESDLRSYETTGTTTTLGYFVAKLGLELPDGLKSSNAELGRLVNQGVREALDQRNFLARSERYSNAAGPSPQPFVFALNPTDTISYPVYEAMLRYVKAQIAQEPDTARAHREEAARLVERDLVKSIESRRNQTWQCLLAHNPSPQFGGMRATVGLELGGDAGQGGYMMSDEYASRIVRQAWEMAVDHANFLSRAEDYEQDALPAPAPIPDDAMVVPFSLEVIKMLSEHLVAQDGARDSGLKDRAFDLLARNLKATVERARRLTCEAQAQLDPSTFGYHVGRLGLDLPGGLAMSDAMRRRMVNQAEETLSNSGHWTQSEGEYLLDVNPQGQVTLPADAVTVLKAEWYGFRVEMRGRQWFYAGRVVRQAEGFLGWFDSSRIVSLNYAGRDNNDQACYVLQGGCTWPDSQNATPKLRALCQRKWIYKSQDADPMLVQHYPALNMMVQSGLDYTAKDYAGYNIKKNSAIKLLDDQLNVETENQTVPIRPNYPGLPRVRRLGAFSRGLY